MKMHKFTGKSKDTRGTEFTYTCYVNDDGSKLYCDTLFGLRAMSLRELKTMLGNY